MDKSAISAVSFLVLNFLFFTSGIAGLFISIIGSGYLVGLIFLAAKISYSLYPIVALFLGFVTPILLLVAALVWGTSLFIACGVIIRRVLNKETKKIERLYWLAVATTKERKIL